MNALLTLFSTFIFQTFRHPLPFNAPEGSPGSQQEAPQEPPRTPEKAHIEHFSNPAASGPRRCETTHRSTQWSFKLREAKLSTISLLIVERSFSFSLGVTPQNPKTSKMHPALSESSDFHEKAVFPLVPSTRPPPHTGGGVVFEGGSKRLQKLLQK